MTPTDLAAIHARARAPYTTADQLRQDLAALLAAHADVTADRDRLAADHRQWVRLANRLVRALSDAHSHRLGDQATRDRWSDLIGWHVQRVISSASSQQADWPTWHEQVLTGQDPAGADEVPVVTR